jgi:hypothetical protein
MEARGLEESGGDEEFVEIESFGGVGTSAGLVWAFAG